METKRIAALQHTVLFGGLTAEALSELAQQSVDLHFSKGEMLFLSGEPVKGLFVVVSGKVRVFQHNADGREQVMHVDTAGSVIADVAVFDGGPFPASAVAIDDAEIAFISRRDFQAYCMEHPEVALKVLQVVGSRLRRLVGIIEELSFTTIRQRLIAALLKLAENEGKKTARGIEFQLPATHQELAHQLGTVRELISRNLMRLQAEGLLDVDARQIVVKDLDGLKALLESTS